MGIKSVNAIVKKYAPDAFRLCSLIHFNQYRMAIDAYGWIIHTGSAISRRVISKMKDPTEDIDRSQILDTLKIACIKFLIKMCEYGVTVVWCWDGKSDPDKKDCLEKRKADREKSMASIDEARAEFEAKHELEITAEDIQALAKKRSQEKVIGREEIGYIRDLVEGLGFPSIEAIADGERLCAALSVEGLVLGVWSQDTDNYALGTKMMVTSFKGGQDENGHPMMEVIYPHMICDGIGCTPEQWRDFCICLGCDFNKNMKGVAGGKLWKLYEKYRENFSIETIEQYETKHDVTPLKYQMCREKLAPQPISYTNESIELRFNWDQFVNNVGMIMQQYDLGEYYHQLLDAVKLIKACPKQVDFTNPPGNEEALIEKIANEVIEENREKPKPKLKIKIVNSKKEDVESKPVKVSSKPKLKISLRKKLPIPIAS